jgi:hypothetical protein
MDKKYLETKKNSLESSVLGVWKTAIEEGYARESIEEMHSLTDEELDQMTNEEIDLFELDDEMFEAAMKKKSAGDRKAAAKKKAKWAKTSGGKKAALKSKKRAAKVRSGTVKVDKSKSKVAKKRAKLYSGNDRNLPDMGEALMQIRAEKQDLDEASGDKEAYKKFFDAALKKFKVSSPAELEGDQKKKFFDYVDKNWEGDNEKAEAAMSQVREYKIQSMKAALAQVWGMEEGKNPFKAEDDDKEVKKNSKTDTGKKAAVIDVNPKIAD